MKLSFDAVFSIFSKILIKPLIAFLLVELFMIHSSKKEKKIAISDDEDLISLWVDDCYLWFEYLSAMSFNIRSTSIKKCLFCFVFLIKSMNWKICFKISSVYFVSLSNCSWIMRRKKLIKQLTNSSIQIDVALWQTQLDDLRKKSEKDFEKRKIDLDQSTARFFDTKVCLEENREWFEKNRGKLNCLNK